MIGTFLPAATKDKTLVLSPNLTSQLATKIFLIFFYTISNFAHLKQTMDSYLMIYLVDISGQIES